MIGTLILFSPIIFGVYLASTYPNGSPWHVRALSILIVPVCIILPLAIDGGGEAIGWGIILAFMFTPIFMVAAFLTEYLARKYKLVGSK
jgi:putative effector of murein hydrolase LrgA (UPF0299 family)